MTHWIDNLPAIDFSTLHMKKAVSPMVNRRRFLKLGVGGTVLVATSGSLFAWFTAGYSQQLSPSDKPISLSPKEFVIVRSLVQALLPEDGKFPSGESVGIPQRFDEEMWAASAAFSSDLKMGLQLLEHAPLLKGFRGRFSSLSIEDRRACIDTFVKGDNDILQQISFGLKEMVHFFYYNHPSVWPAIGYEGPFVGLPVPPPSKIAYEKVKNGGVS